MLFVTVPFSWIWLRPEELKEFGLDLLGGVTFVSNFLDWRGGGYFAAASELKPLMHLWSLSIEEQFYIVYPLMLLTAFKFFKKIDSKSVFLVIIFGVILSEVMSSMRPQLSFFLLPTRFWEFLAGGFVALIIVDKRVHKYDELLSLISFIFLISGLLIVKEDKSYPGFVTLIPVVGTCGLLYYCAPNTTVNKLLKNKVLNIVGLSSFSSYLIHQPVFAFSRIRLNRDLSMIESIFAIVIVLIISFITWKYIEKRYRRYE
jgi:peptidoglycan/LPS O-acetylase OafA/YrhL